NSKDTYFRSKEHALMLDGYILTHIDTKDSKTYYRKTTGNHNSVKIVKDGVVIETRKDYFISIPGSKDVVMTLKSKGNAIDLENATAQIYNSESKKYISIPVNKYFVNAINSSSDITSLLGNDAATYIQGLKGDNDLPFGESPIVLGKPTISKGSGNTATTFIDELVEAVKNAKGYGLKIKHDNNGTSEVEEIVWDNNRKTWYFIRDSKRQELPDPRAYVSQYYVDNHISPVVQIENATNEAGEKVVDNEDLISHSEYSHKNNTIALGDIYTLNNTDYVVSAIIEGNDDVDVHLEQVGSTGSAIVKPHELISSYTAKKHDVINDEEQSEQGEEQFISDRRRRLSASYKNPLFNYLSRIFTNKNNPLGKYDDAQKQAIIRTIYRVKNNILREPRHLSGNLVFHGDYKYIDDSKGVYSPQTYSNGAFVFVLNMKNDDIVSQIRKVLGSRNKLSKDQDAINFMVESIKNFSIIETLKVPVDENRIITTSIYAGNKKRKLNDIIKEINKSNTDDVTKNTYKNFVNGVYDKLPDNKTVKQGGKPVEIDLGEYNSGNALVNENFYCPKAPDTDAEKFIENIEKRGFTVNGTTVVKDKNNQSKQSLVVRDSSGRELALYMIPKTLGQIDQKHKELYDGIIDEIKEFISKGVRAHYSDFLRDYNSLTLVNILMGNKSLILGNGNNDVGLTEIKKHFTFKNSKGLEQNFANLILSKESGKSIQKKQVEALQSFLDNLENKGTSKKDALKNEVMKLRFATKNTKLLNNKDFKQVPLSYYNMNIDNIDSRGFYIPFNDSGVNTKDNFKQDEQDDVFDLNNDHKGNSHFKGGEKIYKEAFDEYYSRVIGKNWKEVVFFTGGN
ncbi:MAG: hypothetical protein WCY37_06350, partial [Candidatus Dojkabacteria bacterium]